MGKCKTQIFLVYQSKGLQENLEIRKKEAVSFKKYNGMLCESDKQKATAFNFFCSS